MSRTRIILLAALIALVAAAALLGTGGEHAIAGIPATWYHG